MIPQNTEEKVHPHSVTSDESKSKELIALKERGRDLGKFVAGLADEGERSAVVLGASRADLILDELLKATMRRHPGGSDNLFDVDRPLGSFSARIALAFRLGLIDEACEHALQMPRKIRNDFAHSTTRASLSESRHKSRVVELVREAKKCGTRYEQFEPLFKKYEPTLKAFCTAVTVVLACLDFNAYKACKIQPPCVAKLDTEVK